MPVDLSRLLDALAADPGLLGAVAPGDRSDGLAAASDLAGLLAQTLTDLNLNADGLITASDLSAVSAAIRADGAASARFQAAHGNDGGGSETGYHLLQNDGGSLVFQGRNLADTVADAIFHFGFATVNGRLVNEDGALNQPVARVAGWLNHFINGVTLVEGSDQADRLTSGAYSADFAGAENELWLAGGGDDRVRAGLGADTIQGGTGADLLLGEAGDDEIQGEAGNDALRGGEGQDSLSGDEGDDLLRGQEGDDLLSGGGGRDVLRGGAGQDSLWGGAGADRISLAETVQACDVIVLASGDSGTMGGLADLVTGFVSGIDKLDLTALGPMSFEAAGFSGTGASAWYDGAALRIDGDGDGTCDMTIRFHGLADLVAGDVLML